MAEKLKSIGVNGAQITIDGTKSVNDARKTFKNGNGSYDVIMNNIKEIAGILDELNIRVNVDKQNLDNIPALIKEIKNLNLLNKINKLYFSPVVPSPGPIDNWNDYIFTPKEKAEAMIKLWNISLKEGFKIGVFPQYMQCGTIMDPASIVSPSGDFYACIGFVGEKMYKSGSLYSKENTNIHMQLVEEDVWDKHCKECKFIPYCGGGCRVLAQIINKDVKSKFCEKEYFEIAYPEYLKAKFNDKIKNHNRDIESRTLSNVI